MENDVFQKFLDTVMIVDVDKIFISMKSEIEQDGHVPKVI